MPQRPVTVVPDGPFDFPWLVSFLEARAAPALEAVSLDGIVRALRIAGRPVLLTIRPARPGAAVAGLPDGRAHATAPPARAAFTVVADPPVDAEALTRITRHFLDLEGDLGPFRRMAAADPLLARLVEARPGIRLPQIPDPFEALCRAILGQQVSVAAARTLTDRLVRTLGDPVAAGFRVFPDAAALARTPVDTLGHLGLTRARARALHGVAEAVAAGAVDWDHLAAAPFEEAVPALCTLPGVGPWTAAYVRMRGLADHDAFPATDLGVVRSIRRLHPRGEALSGREIAETAERWRPWRGYATVHLWNARD